MPVLQFYKGLQADVAARNASTNPPTSAELKVWISQLMKASENLVTDLLLGSLEHYKMLKRSGITVINVGDPDRKKDLLQALHIALLSKQTTASDTMLIAHHDLVAQTMRDCEEPFIAAVDILGMALLGKTLSKEGPAVYSNYLFVYVYNNPPREGSEPIPSLLTPDQQELSRLILENHATIPMAIAPINGEGKTMASISECVLKRVREATTALQQARREPVSQVTRHTFMPPPSQKTYQRQCVLVGDSGVGKSALLQRWKVGTFREVFTPTYGADMLETHVDKKPIRIWDLSGASRFFTITSSFLPMADVVMLVFDVTSRESVNNIQLWLERLQTYCKKPEFKLILIGNKCDLENERVVGSAEVSQAIKQWNAKTQGKMHINAYGYMETR